MKHFDNESRNVDEQLREDLAEIDTSKVPYIIEGLMPAHQVHLIGGPSGGGKTTLSFQMYESLSQGLPFLGRQTRQVKFAYVSGDRTAESVRETQERCGVSFPVFSLVDENLVGEDLIQKIIPRLTAKCGYRPDFIYIDGFTALVPGGFLNSYSVVAKWLAQLQRYCWKMGITILGACHTTKVKEGEKFTNPRQRIAGSVAWAGFSESVIIIEPAEDNPECDKRVVNLLPRNHKGEVIIMKFSPQGRLELPQKIQHQEEITNFVMESMMEALVPGTMLYFSKLKEIALEKGIAARTFERWLAKYIEQGKLVRARRGEYVIPVPASKSAEEINTEAQAV